MVLRFLEIVPNKLNCTISYAIFTFLNDNLIESHLEKSGVMPFIYKNNVKSLSLKKNLIKSVGFCEIYYTKQY